MSDTIAVEPLDQVQIEPFFELMAQEPFWPIFTPEREAKADTLPIEARARWLVDVLNRWAVQVDGYLAEPGERGPESDHVRTLEVILESLRNAANALLGYRRRDYPIPIPDRFSQVAYSLFVEADERGVGAADKLVYQVARRLSAARSHLEPSSQTNLRIDDQGRVFKSSGERMFQADGEMILRGMQQIREGKYRTLDEIREAEGRNER